MADDNIQPVHFFASDTAFDELYPDSIKLLAHRHWTPLDVAKKAAAYLAADENAKILDIGSGVGKFCLAAAYYKPAAFFYGVEQRESLIEYAEAARVKLGLKNVSFIPENFTAIDFKQYDHFYFYNSFYENISGTQKIDNAVEYSKELYSFYNFSLYRQLEKMPPGTKLVTFHIIEDEWPKGYHVVGTELDDALIFLMKI